MKDSTDLIQIQQESLTKCLYESEFPRFINGGFQFVIEFHVSIWYLLSLPRLVQLHGNLILKYILCAFQEFEENPINELLGWYGYENDSRPESTRPNNNNNNNINSNANSGDMSKQEEEKKNREARKQRLLKCVAEITPIIRQSMESNSIECSGELCEEFCFILLFYTYT